MRTVFEAKSAEGEIFFFKGRELPALLCAYTRAIPSGVVRDYNIDGNGEDFVCFSLLRDARAKDSPVLSLEKSQNRVGRVSYKLYSRASGALKVYEDSFIKLTAKLEKELKSLKRQADKKIVRPKFGSPRP